MALTLKAQKNVMDAVVNAVATKISEQELPSLILPNLLIEGSIKQVSTSLQAAVKRYNDDTAPVLDRPELLFSLTQVGTTYTLQASKVDDFAASVEEALDSAIFLAAGEKYVPVVELADDEVAKLVEDLLTHFMRLEQQGLQTLIDHYAVDVTEVLAEVTEQSIKKVLQVFYKEYTDYYTMMNDDSSIGEVTPLYVEYTDSTKSIVLVMESNKDEYKASTEISATVERD